jgi:hypothetical protein
MARESDEGGDAAGAAQVAASSGSGALAQLSRSLGAAGKGMPPVERWNPPFCGEIDMRIAADGAWFYNGTPIGRPALVKLFSSVLKLEDGRHVLVTPVEKLGIRVDDAPLVAVEMAVEGEDDGRSVAFRTLTDDLVSVGPDHALRFERGVGDGVRPYVHVRRGLWARVTRALTYDLLALGDVRELGGEAMYGVMAGGIFHPVMTAAELDREAGER